MQNAARLFYCLQLTVYIHHSTPKKPLNITFTAYFIALCFFIICKFKKLNNMVKSILKVILFIPVLWLFVIQFLLLFIRWLFTGKSFTDYNTIIERFINF